MKIRRCKLSWRHLATGIKEKLMTTSLFLLYLLLRGATQLTMSIQCSKPRICGLRLKKLNNLWRHRPRFWTKVRWVFGPENRRFRSRADFEPEPGLFGLLTNPGRGRFRGRSFRARFWARLDRWSAGLATGMRQLTWFNLIMSFLASSCKQI